MNFLSIISFIFYCIAVVLLPVTSQSIQCDPESNPVYDGKPTCEGDYELGMTDYRIPDSSLTSSTSFDAKETGPHSGRLNLEVLGGAWCPKNHVSENDFTQYIQINLERTCIIKSIITQGRNHGGRGTEFTKSYHVQYISPESIWKQYCNPHTLSFELKGNNDTTSLKTNVLKPWIRTSFIRLIPVSTRLEVSCLRAGITGCCAKDNTTKDPSLVDVEKKGPNILDGSKTIPDLKSNWTPLILIAALIIGTLLLSIILYQRFHKMENTSVNFHVATEDPAAGINLLENRNRSTRDVGTSIGTPSVTG